MEKCKFKTRDELVKFITGKPDIPSSGLPGSILQKILGTRAVVYNEIRDRNATMYVHVKTKAGTYVVPKYLLKEKTYVHDRPRVQESDAQDN